MNKNYFYLLLVSFLFCIQYVTIAEQSSEIDSLKKELSKAGSTNDSARILTIITWKISDSNPDLTYWYGMKSLSLSSRIQNKERLAEIFDAAALAYWVKGDQKSAREYYNKALVIGYKYNFLYRIAWENYHLAEISLNEKKIDDTYNLAVNSRAAFKKLNNIEMVIYSDWLFLNAQKEINSPFVDTTIIDYESAVKNTNDPNLLLDIYINLTYLYRQKENKSKSMFYAMKTLDIAEKTNDKKAILNAYYQIGDYLRDYQHNYEIALLYYEKVLESYEKIKCEASITGILNDIGITYELMGNNSLALKYFNKSLDLSLKINHRHSIANAYKSLGEIYLKEKNYTDALNYYIRCYETGCDKCPQITFHKVLVDIGNVYLNRNDYTNALKYFEKSLTLADSFDAQYEKAVSYSALGDLFKVNNHNKAINYYNIGLNLASKTNLLSLRKEISYKLSAVYKEEKNFQKAFEYLDLYKVLSDSLIKLNAAENLSRLETNFEFQNLKNREDLIKLKADEEIKKQSQQKYFLLIGIALVSSLVLVVYLNFRRKKRDNLILKQQQVQIKEMSLKVHEADQKKLSFFTNISHELRTPLTLILGPVEKLIKENFNNQKSSSLLSIVQRNTLQLYNLINQLLDIRKLDTGNIKLKVSQGDITAYCKGIFTTFCHIADEKEISYQFDSTDTTISGWFDKDILEKTLNNLLSNAFKFTPQNGAINMVVSTEPSQTTEVRYINIEVKDNGKGIPEDQIQYVFDRYYQVENTNTGFNTGTGIGLAYSKELIELHKGELNVVSKLNNGTTFTIKLPVHESYYSENEKSGDSSLLNIMEIDEVRQKYLENLFKSESETDNNLKTESIDERKVMLIIEDNTDLRTFIRSIFDGRFLVYESDNGIEGFQNASEIIPDIILCDIMMPGMNGLELCNKLKHNITTNHIPILVLTAKSGEENEIEGLKKGADDYLTKPFNPEILEMRVQRLIESKEKLKEYFTREFLLNPSKVVAVSPEDEFLKKAVKVVEDNISSPDLNVELLMKELAVSRTQLFRKLKGITNCSAGQFIKNIKLKRAAQLLQSHSYNITEVLYQSGFNSPSYFTACFKEMYGCLPKDYHSRTKSSGVIFN